MVSKGGFPPMEVLMPSMPIQLFTIQIILPDIAIHKSAEDKTVLNAKLSE